MLKGKGCVYRKCAFCDYYLDSSPEEAANFAVNRAVLERVTGEFSNLEVINSGSVFELDADTLRLVRAVCTEKGIGTIHFEAHDLYRGRLALLREEFAGFELKMKLGLETFDWKIREGLLRKGIRETDPGKIADGFEEANFLIGVTGQTVQGIRTDIELGLRYFERICLNVMCENTSPIQPDAAVIAAFQREIYPEIRSHPRIDILLENTDFGVGEFA